MEAPKLDKSRIAKNTLILYVRMIVVLGVSLLTSRLTLKALGIDDFGVFNVVAGTVGMLAVLTGSIASAISRFITYELGKEAGRPGLVFSTAMTIQLVVALGVVVIGEPLGVWLVNSELNIPAESIVGANYVLQVNLFLFALGLIAVPYQAIIVAYERMTIYAYMSFFDAGTKLVVSYILLKVPGDKLVIYSMSLVAFGIVSFLIYRAYCLKSFKDAQYKVIWKPKLMKEMFGYAGWNMIGAFVIMARDQGGNILINMFFGPAINAAKGLAGQINNALQGIAGAFLASASPQITKSYAMGERDYMLSLVNQTSRFSYYLMMIFAIPVLMNLPILLKLWLGEVPSGTLLFSQLTIILAMGELLCSPLSTYLAATGRIKIYQISIGVIQILNIPASYLLLKSGCIPEVVTIVAIVTSQLCVIARVFVLHFQQNYSIKAYVKSVYWVVIRVTMLSCIFPLMFTYNKADSLLEFIGYSIVTIAIESIIVLYWGCSRSERGLLLQKMQRIIWGIIGKNTSTLSE